MKLCTSVRRTFAAAAEAGKSEPRRSGGRSSEEEVKGGAKPSIGRPSMHMLLGLPAPPSQLLLLRERTRQAEIVVAVVILLLPLLSMSLDAATSERGDIIIEE